MYFSKFPKINYNHDSIHDLTIRTGMLSVVKSNLTLFDDYHIKDGDTPEILAFNLYGSPNYLWIITMANDIIDPLYDWFLFPREFERYLVDKYGDRIGAAHHYELDDGTVVPESAAGASPISNRTYEFRINDKKRTIKLLKPEYLSDIVEEFEHVLRNA